MKRVSFVILLLLVVPGAFADSVTITYTYDKTYRLKTVTYGYDGSTVSYTYDANGNRTNLTRNAAAPDIIKDASYEVPPDPSVVIGNLAGRSYQLGAKVWLSRMGEIDIQGTSIVVHSPNRISCQLDLFSASPGPWDIHVENPDGKSDVFVEGLYVTTEVKDWKLYGRACEPAKSTAKRPAQAAERSGG